MLSAPGPLADRARAIAAAVCKRNESKGWQEQKGWNAPGWLACCRADAQAQAQSQAWRDVFVGAA